MRLAVVKRYHIYFIIQTLCMICQVSTHSTQRTAEKHRDINLCIRWLEPSNLLTIFALIAGYLCT